MDEKPLHVRVAEALGCKPVQATPGPRSWRCTCPQASDALNFLPHGWADTPYVAPYDIEWSATGPLIEKYGFRLRRDPINAGEVHNPDELEYVWEARDERGEFCAEGATALLAICALIIDLNGLRAGTFR